MLCLEIRVQRDAMCVQVVVNVVTVDVGAVGEVEHRLEIIRGFRCGANNQAQFVQENDTMSQQT